MMHKVLVGVYWELCGPHPAVLRFRASLRRRPLTGSAVLGRAGSWHGRLGRRHLGRQGFAGTRAARSRRVGFPGLSPGHPERLSSCPTLVRRLPSGVSLSPPASQLFLGLSRMPRSAVNRPSRDSKRSFVFPRGQQPNASLFSGTKRFSEAGADSFPSPQHPAPLQVQNACSRPAGLGVGWGPGSPG